MLSLWGCFLEEAVEWLLLREEYDLTLVLEFDLVDLLAVSFRGVLGISVMTHFGT